MPTKNFDVPMLTIKGVAMYQESVEDGKQVRKPLLLSDIAMHVLYLTSEADKQLPARDRNNLISLAIRIGEGGDREYSTSELALILERTAKVQDNLSLYRMTELIDGPDAAKG